MCFSASASFSTGAVLAVAGLVALKKIQSPTQLLFAAIPLLFSVQQFSEGFIWLPLTNKGYESWKLPATYAFLFFAQVVWPVLVPVAIYKMESNAGRKKILALTCVMGLLVSLYLAWCLLSFKVDAAVVSMHISYTLNFPVTFSFFSGMCYFIPTVVPPFFSSNKKVPLLGIIILTSYLITKIFYYNYLISVWCFFAALISVLIVYIITSMNKLPAKIIKLGEV